MLTWRETFACCYIVSQLYTNKYETVGTRWDITNNSSMFMLLFFFQLQTHKYPVFGTRWNDGLFRTAWLSPSRSLSGSQRLLTRWNKQQTESSVVLVAQAPALASATPVGRPTESSAAPVGVPADSGAPVGVPEESSVVAEQAFHVEIEMVR